LTEDYAARLKDPQDPLLRILRAAKSWGGQPPTRFLLVPPPPKVTTYQHDSAGRVVRAETVEWTSRDVELALALEEYEAALCPGCGGDLDETIKRENEFRYTAESDLCHRCVALDLEARTHEEHSHPNAFRYSVRKRSETPPVPEDGGEQLRAPLLDRGEGPNRQLPA
jgi:predicted RNA-binding Zn-ribbon protein involved in translation (DUF1610 family)